jgi:hypothetical protein
MKMLSTQRDRRGWPSSVALRRVERSDLADVPLPPFLPTVFEAVAIDAVTADRRVHFDREGRLPIAPEFLTGSRHRHSLRSGQSSS